MKCTIPEISWHNREPVLSVDINPISSETYRLATSGGDNHVLIWLMNLSENGAVKQELVSDLTRHQRAVNVVRWSPSGQYLASADDDANIIIWQQKTDNIPLLEGDTGDKEIWIVYKVLRGHKEDIYDLCWSTDGLKLFSGSIDNTAMLWDLNKGKMDHILSDHKGFVQGVAWDPKNQLIATISTDRICRLFPTNGKNVKARIHKGQLPVSSNHYLYKKEVKYFYDDTFKSFFRRLQFSPDGSLLAVPSGHIETDDCKKTLNATLIFTLDNLNEPAAILPHKNQCSTAVRFCPILFELHEDGPTPIVNLSYRMIFAVSTDHDVILYDTQQNTPFARFQEIHYTRLTDLTWSNDGRLLVASSTDGFCALITFDVDELGVPYVKEESEPEDSVMDISGCEELEKDNGEELEDNKQASTSASNEKKRPSFIEQWAIKTPKRIKLDNDNMKTVPKVGEIIEITDDDDDDVKELSSDIRKEINELIPTRATSKIENKINDDKSVAKPIAVRRKPRQPEIEEAKNGAKLIEVRRKPRDVSSYMENEPINKTAETKVLLKEVNSSNILENNEAKIEKNTNEKSLESEEIVEVTDSEKTDLFLEKEKTKSTKSQKKDTKSEQPTKMKVPSLIKKSTPTKLKSSTKEVKNSNIKENNEGKIEKSTNETSMVSEEIIEIKDCKETDLTSDKEKTKSRKKDTKSEQSTKSKVSSLTKKSTPLKPKNSPLLKFLKKSAEKSKKHPKKEILRPVDLTLGEEEARDAWKCEKETSNQNVESQKPQADDEDLTEDFCLQLENTQESEEKKPEGETEEDKKSQISLGSADKTVRVDAAIEISEDSNDSGGSSISSKTLNKIDNVEQKMPRRVPLITLSSPKGNKKQKS